MNNESDSSLLCDCKGQTTPPEYFLSSMNISI